MFVINQACQIRINICLTIRVISVDIKGNNRVLNSSQPDVVIPLGVSCPFVGTGRISGSLTFAEGSIQDQSGTSTQAGFNDGVGGLCWF